MNPVQSLNLLKLIADLYAVVTAEQPKAPMVPHIVQPENEKMAKVVQHKSV